MNEPIDILIISAMEIELKKIATLIDESHSYNLEQLVLKKGKIHHHQIGTSLIGIGKVEAAMNTQKLISHLNPKMIIFTGVAGGLNPDYKVGDIVLGTETFQHDYGFLGSDGKLTTRKTGTMPEIGIGNAEECFLIKLTESEHFTTFKEAALESSKHFKSIKDDHTPNLHLGKIATGDQFISSFARKEELRGMEADAVEMEGAVVSYVAARNNIPSFLIRSISDSACDEAVVDFPVFAEAAAENNGQIVDAFLKKLVL